ncbi:DUF2568 domain-containing protein [Gulosibacter faecalis]|uniref:DUF2568 domain-containing protein n=1 Tax=Gulosibacter faecalis TaxID=272240 RepID=A0ABW5UZE0_9MICO|nr:DUF2568 domain-containing protein [Gulosibacter faecalis]
MRDDQHERAELGDSGSANLALTVRFLLEIGLLVAVAIVVVQLVAGWLGWVLAALLVVAVATLWGVFLSPKAPIRRSPGAKLALEAALFLAAGIGLAVIGHAVTAVLGLVIWAIDRIALARLGR